MKRASISPVVFDRYLSNNVNIASWESPPFDSHPVISRKLEDQVEFRSFLHRPCFLAFT